MYEMIDLGAAALYFPVIWITRALGPMEKGPKFDALSIVYNLVMIAFSFVSAVVAGEFVFRNKSAMPMQCDEAFDKNPIFAYTVLAFYLSKYVEWFDTVFLLLRNKPASFLHQFHHIGAPIAVGLLYHTKSESAWVFVGLNGLVHTFMYSYYLLCIFGVDIKVVRQWITNAQLLQFVTGFYWLWIFYEPQYCGPAHRFCFWFQYGYVSIVMLLFINFYVQSYLRPKRHHGHKKEGEAAAAASTNGAAETKGRRRSSSPKSKK